VDASWFRAIYYVRQTRRGRRELLSHADIKDFAKMIRNLYGEHDDALAFLSRSYEEDMNPDRYAALYYELKMLYAPKGMIKRRKWQRVARQQRKKLQEI